MHNWYTITSEYGEALASFLRWDDAISYADQGVQRHIYQYGVEIHRDEGLTNYLVNAVYGVKSCHEKMILLNHSEDSA